MHAVSTRVPLNDPRWTGWRVGEHEAATVDLAALDPSAQPFGNGDKAANRAQVENLAEQLDLLQDHFYADGRRKLLVVLRGLDTSGKDGTIRGVFHRTSPLGVHTVAFKAPSSTELAYDYLWRVHQRVPRAGEIVIFNRSHYEDVLVPVVNGWITPEQTQQRYHHLREFERLLAETGTVILKCFLHISKDEQRQRLQARLDDHQKHWKFDPSDLAVRKQWDAYQRAYADAINATASPWAPWHIIPANSKTHRNLMVASLVRDTLAGLDLRYPTPDFDPSTIRIE